MSDRPITLVISDLHVGAGPQDPGDDHIYQGRQLVRFLREEAGSADGLAGRIELFINGDFLEFAQTNQAAFSHLSDDLWCTELESLAKLESIVQGHPDIFEELDRFQAHGNLVTIAAGNHDVDLIWPKVQQRLRQAAGEGLRFEVGKSWVERHGGALQIGHGHQSDPANSFKHWGDPIRTTTWGVQRLEMCPGTLFMVKFVNKLEADYPFADNLLPVTKLASVLLREDKPGFASIGWAFARLVGTSPLSTLGGGAGADPGSRLLHRFANDPALLEHLRAALAAHGLAARHAWPGIAPPTTQGLAAAMFDLLGKLDDDAWRRLFDMPPAPAVLGGDAHTLRSLAKASFDDGKETLRSVARQRVDATQATVVVMGHTHQPDQRRFGPARYYNPGCWTRYLELRPDQAVTLEDLRDESRYPYQLNVVRVENRGGALVSEMRCFEEG